MDVSLNNRDALLFPSLALLRSLQASPLLVFPGLALRDSRPRVPALPFGSQVIRPPMAAGVASDPIRAARSRSRSPVAPSRCECNNCRHPPAVYLRSVGRWFCAGCVVRDALGGRPHISNRCNCQCPECNVRPQAAISSSLTRALRDRHTTNAPR